MGGFRGKVWTTKFERIINENKSFWRSAKGEEMGFGAFASEKKINFESATMGVEGSNVLNRDRRRVLVEKK